MQVRAFRRYLSRVARSILDSQYRLLPLAGPILPLLYTGGELDTPLGTRRRVRVQRMEQRMGPRTGEFTGLASYLARGSSLRAVVDGTSGIPVAEERE
ncbi:unnamed protein product [Closterium sp. NIES-64]|nr:unnamed protein product [Closterium sp. NIES-64]